MEQYLSTDWLVWTAGFLVALVVAFVLLTFLRDIKRAFRRWRRRR